MSLDQEQELEDFRAEVARFLDEAPTPAIREAGRKTTSAFPSFAEAQEWLGILNKKGWAAPAWPEEYGGTGWSVEQRYIFEEERCKRDLPPLLPNALRMVGPLLIDLGTEEQKAKYLPRILSGEDYWTQGYSEPNSGSDLASLKCSAVADGDDYIINGSKIWTTLAHESNRMFMLVRTSNEGKKHAGITFLLLDRTDYPGMEIRPIDGLDGFPECCEVFFDNVRVPQSGRVGEENNGWSVAKHLLMYERGVGANSPSLKRKLEKIRELATQRHSASGGILAQDSMFQRELGEIEADVATLEHFERLSIGGHEISLDPALPSMVKIMHSELVQQVTQLMRKLSGLNGLALDKDALRVGAAQSISGDDLDLVAMPFYLNSRATTIYAGTNEIQRDLIARTLPAG